MLPVPDDFEHPQCDALVEADLLDGISHQERGYSQHCRVLNTISIY